MSKSPIPGPLTKYLHDQITSLSPEWYQIKQLILTSTNVAAVLEYDVYKSKLDMFRRKVQQQNTLATSEAILWGLKYEPVARQLCAQRHGIEIYETGLKRHPKYPFLGATPDGVSYNDHISSSSSSSFVSALASTSSSGANQPQIILHEFKCLKSRQITRKIPLEYWVQMQVAMEVWDIEGCMYSENIFQEYADEPAFNRDTRTPANHKGVLPIGTNIYVGTSPDLSKGQTRSSNNSGIVKSTDPYYWFLQEHWDFLVRRDRKWMAEVMPKILEFWRNVRQEQDTLGLKSPSFPVEYSTNINSGSKIIDGPVTRSNARKRKILDADTTNAVDESKVKNKTESTDTTDTSNKSKSSDNSQAQDSSDKSSRPRSRFKRARRSTQLATQPQTTSSYHYLNLDWSQCIRANQLYAYLKNDPVVDWLDIYGHANHYHKDPISPFQMPSFIFHQSNQFKTSLIEYLKTQLDALKLSYYDVFEYPELNNISDPLFVSYNYHSSYFLNRTKEAIQRRVPIIFNGLLLHPNARIFGRADLIIKEDLLSRLFPTRALDQELPKTSDLYVAVSIKFASLNLTVNGDTLLNTENQKFYQLQSLILSQTLSAIQSKPVQNAYLISRRIKCKRQNIDSDQADHNLFQIKITDHHLEETLQSGVQWLQELKLHGHDWHPELINQDTEDQTNIPDEYVDNLRPNLKNRYDSQWHQAKKQIAQTQQELTTIMNLGYRYRQKLITEHDITQWTQLTLPLLQEIRLPQADLVWEIINTNLQQIPINLTHFDPESLMPRQPIEFFIDFETVNDLYDDFSQVPLAGGQDMIYLIGCLVLDHRNPDPQYHCFLVDDLSQTSEEKLLREFFNFLKLTLRASKIPAVLYHWTQAETLHLEKALGRYDSIQRPPLELVDLYKIFRENQITLTGAFSYGLKPVAKAFHRHGLIQTIWKDGLDGAQASVGAWRAMDECKQSGISKLSETRTIQTLIDYNYNDCRVLYEMTEYLRQFSDSESESLPEIA